MKILVVIFSALLFHTGYAQEIKKDCYLPDSLMYTDVFYPAPQFPGGCDSLLKFIKKEMQYPRKAKKKKIEGRVMTLITIRGNGEIKSVRVPKSVNKHLDREAIRIVQAMPKWLPGIEWRSTGVIVIPIRFELDNTSTR